MTVEQIKATVTLRSECERRGIKLLHAGQSKVKCLCPFHQEKTPSCCIDEDKNLFYCHGCKASGSVIDFVMRLDGVNFKAACSKLGGDSNFEPKRPEPKPNIAGKICAIYSYQDVNGLELYQVVRMDPKDFRQRHQVNGEWIWRMDGVNRVLYRLPEVSKSNRVIITEGEKDADTLSQLGFTATCNVGGAGKWMDSYTESLAEKEIILCGDNDGPGRDHIKMVTESISGKVKSTRTIWPPDPFKDVSDWVQSFGLEKINAKAAIEGAISSAPLLFKGLDIPVFSMVEMESEYVAFVKKADQFSFSLAKWLPELAFIRPLVPGEVATFVSDTGVGKTCLLQGLAKAARPLPFLLFEMELPSTLLFERFIQSAGCLPHHIVEAEYKNDQTWRPGIDKFLNHIFCCPRSGITVAEIERIINRAELKIGQRPKVIGVDYLQLIQGKGATRYERGASVAEDLKVLAKTSQTIIIAASQIKRKAGDEGIEIQLHDAKGAGEIENSSGLLIGCWRPQPDLMKLKILKNTKGISGKVIEAKFDGTTMRISSLEKDPPSYDHVEP